jgi:hypothetical protein
MIFWINFWTIFFIVSLALFAGLAIVVTIGGFFNIRSLLKDLTSRAKQQEENSAARCPVDCKDND